jgi:hypothetical protein
MDATMLSMMAHSLANCSSVVLVLEGGEAMLNKSGTELPWWWWWFVHSGGGWLWIPIWYG